jgi:hypothetical protein
MRPVPMTAIFVTAVAFVVGDALASALVTGSWMATLARATGLAAYVLVLFIVSTRKAA